MKKREQDQDIQMKRKQAGRRAVYTAAGLLLAISLLAGCGRAGSQASGPTASAAGSSAASDREADTVQETAVAAEDQVVCDETIAGWHIQVENVRVDTSMQNISVDLGYSGVETSEYVKEAGEGKTFCLVKMKIEKDGSREQIEWDKMVLTDAHGREYYRIEDAFIADLGMKHMPGSNLNFGINEGWIAFEIDEDAKGAVLSYPFEEDTFTLDLGF